MLISVTDVAWTEFQISRRKKMSRDRESIDEVLRKNINEGLNVNPFMPRTFCRKPPPRLRQLHWQEVRPKKETEREQ